MKAYEIPKELNTNESTISRDIKYLSSQSQNYLNELAKQTLPFMYQTSIEGNPTGPCQYCPFVRTKEYHKETLHYRK
jgi:hypothetical protein